MLVDQAPRVFLIANNLGLQYLNAALGTLRCAYHDDLRKLWSLVKANDYVFIRSPEQEDFLESKCYRVGGKGFLDIDISDADYQNESEEDLSEIAVRFDLRLELKRALVPFEYGLILRGRLDENISFMDFPKFERVFEVVECIRGAPNNYSQEKRYMGLLFNVCQNSGEESSVRSLLRLHKYGAGSGFIHCIGREDDRVVVGALLDADNGFRKSVAADKGIERFDFVRKYILLIRRIAVNNSSVWQKLRRQRAMIRFCKFVAQSYSKEKILVLGGNSHDAQPAAIEEDVVCEIPTETNQSMFYWFPLRGFAKVDRRSKLETYRQIKKFRKARALR